MVHNLPLIIKLVRLVIERVDLSCLNFVRIKCFLLAAQGLKHSDSMKTPCNKEKEAFKRMQRTAFINHLYRVIAHLSRITTRHELSLV